MSGRRLTEAERRLLHQRIREHLDAYPDGIPGFYREQLMESFTISRATWFRELRAVTDGAATTRQLVATRPRWEITEAMHPFLSSSFSATLLEAHAAISERFDGVPKYEHFTKCFHRLDAGLRMKLRHAWGKDSPASAFEPAMLEDAPHPGYRWAIDEKDSHTLVTPDHRFAPTTAHVISIVDDASRFRFAVPVLGTPSGGHLRAALAEAVWQAGGMPLEVRMDNLAAHLAEETVGLVERWGGRVARTTSRRSRQNGKVERVNLDTEHLAVTMPQNTRAPRRRDMSPVARRNGVLTMSAFTAELLEHTAERNRAVHTETGRVPAEMFFSDACELIPVPAEEIAALALHDPWPRGPKEMENTGVMLFGVRYTAPELFGVVDERFHLRYLPTERGVVFVFTRDGRFLAEATPTKQAPVTVRRGMTAHNATTDRQAQAAHVTGAQLRDATREDGSYLRAPEGWQPPEERDTAAADVPAGAPRPPKRKPRERRAATEPGARIASVDELLNGPEVAR